MVDIKSFLINYITSIIGIVLALGISIIDPASETPFISDRQVVAAFASLILIQISLTLNQLEQPVSEIKRFVDNRAITESIREADFYERFQRDVENAQQRVLITYFHNEDPLQSNDQEKARYYRNLENLIDEKSQQNVEFKRIIRGVPQLEGWIDHLLDQHEGAPNYSLAVTMDEEPEAVLKSHVAVQLIDDNIVYFVAIGEQQEYSDPRDMYIRSKKLNTQWERYYDRIWENSCTLINRGNILEQNVDECKEHMRELKDGE